MALVKREFLQMTGILKMPIILYLSSDQATTFYLSFFRAAPYTFTY